MPWDYRRFRAAVRASSLPPLVRLLAYTLNEYMPKVYPSVETLCEETGMSTRSVQRAIQTLEDEGWLLVERRHNATSVYTLVSPVLSSGATQTPGARETPPSGVSERHQGVSERHQGGARETPLGVPERHPKKTSEAVNEADNLSSLGTSSSEPASQTENVSQSTVAPRRSPKRGTRIPPNWEPSNTDANHRAEQGIDVNDQLDRFRDYWVSKPGKGGVKLDWDATWRNWCRNARRRSPANTNRTNVSILAQEKRIRDLEAAEAAEQRGAM